MDDLLLIESDLPITDVRMTRFWITLRQGIEFVLKNVSRMHGGEILVHKISSVRIVDLAKAMAPQLEQQVVGIRPSEKLREIMCPAEDSHLTLEFDDHSVIQPTIQMSGHVDFTTNRLGEAGRPVVQRFEYHSGKNSHFLSIDEIVVLNQLAGA